MNKASILIIFCLCLTTTRVLFCKSSEKNKILSSVKNLEQQLAGRIGVYALEVKSGKVLEYNAELSFPMASVRKIAIAVKLLQMVDRGVIDLSEHIQLKPTDWRPGSGILSNRLVFNDARFSLGELLRLMLEESDNSATDILTDKVGGPLAITQWLEAMNIYGIRLDRTSLELKADYHGVTDCLKKHVDKSLYEACEKSISERHKKCAQRKFMNDPRDSTSPQAMGHFLNAILKQNVLSANSQELLFKHMQLNQKSLNRISGLLPREIAIAHKGGTLGNNYYTVTNDIAFLNLPNNEGMMLMIILIKSNKSALQDREKAIAKIALLIFNYFTNAG